MAAVTDGSDLLVSMNPNDALLFSVNERDGVRTEQSDSCSQVQILPVVASSPSDCVMTKAIEVCVNGVKQVIVIPLALSSDDVTTVSSTASLPGCSSSSSVIGSTSLYDIPDDVKLLAQSCILGKSSSVSYFGTPAVFSAATNGCSPVSTSFTNNIPPPPSYPLFNASRMPFANSSAGVLQDPFTAPTAPFPTNYFSNRPTVPSSVIPPHPSPSFPAAPGLPTPPLPLHGFSPAHMSTPPQQPFPFSGGRNTVLPSQFPPGLNNLQHLHPSTISQAPWTSYHPLEVRPTYGRMNTTTNTAVNNYMQPGPNATDYRLAFDSSLTNHSGRGYGQQFLPSSYNTIVPDFSGNRPSLQIRDYLFRKRGVLPQNAAQGPPTDAGSFGLPRFNPRFFDSSAMPFQRPPPMSNSNLRTSVSRSTVKKPSGSREQHRVTVGNNSFHPIASMSRAQVSSESPGFRFAPPQALHRGVSGNVTSAACQTIAGSPNVVISNQSERPQNTTNTSRCQTVSGVTVGMQGSVNNTMAAYMNTFQTFVQTFSQTSFINYPNLSRVLSSATSVAYSTHTGSNTQQRSAPSLETGTSLLGISSSDLPTNVTTETPIAVTMDGADFSVLPQNGINTSRCPPVTGIPADVRFSVNRTQATSLPVSTIVIAPVTAVTTRVTETTCHATAAVQASPPVALNTTIRSVVESSRANGPRSLPTDIMVETPITAVTLKEVNLPVLPQRSTNTSRCPPVTGVPVDVRFSVNQTQATSLPVSTIVIAPVTTRVTETTCHATAAVQALAPAESSLLENSEHETIMFNVRSDLTAVSVPSNCCTVQRSGTSLEIGTSQFGDSCIDLGSLPTDVMIETSESELLLTSFCNMFEQSNTAHQNFSGVSDPMTSTAVQDSFKNGQLYKDSSVNVHDENAKTGLQLAKSLGKGRYFVEEMRQRRQEQASRKRRRTRLTCLEVADDSNSSESWHPDSHSESSDYQSISSPPRSPVSSVSQSSDDFVVKPAKRGRGRQTAQRRQKRRSSRRIVHATRKSGKAGVHVLPSAVTRKCTVMLERLQLDGQCSVNVHLLDSIICCPQQSRIKRVQRLFTSDSDCSDDLQPIKKLRIRIPHVEESDSS